MKLEGWTAGIWRWMIFSRGSQRSFSPKTAVKALDRDLGTRFCIVFYMRRHAHFLCARDRVPPPLGLDWPSTERTMADGDRSLRAPTNVGRDIALGVTFTGVAAWLFGGPGACTAVVMLGVINHIWTYYSGLPHNPEKESIPGSLGPAVSIVSKGDDTETTTVIPNRERSELKGTLEFIELYRVVPEASIDKSWPKLDENPSEEDIEYLKQARILSKTSPDVDFQVGAIIVCPRTKKILGEGFNRMPPGCEEFPWGEVGDILNTKFPYVFHGVRAAILDALMKKADLKGATVYTTLIPDHIDSQMIREVGITRVVYEDDVFSEFAFTVASKKILRGLDCRQIKLPDHAI